MSAAVQLHPIAQAARDGLLATTKTLPPWLFYDAAGSDLFERITELPEYYLTRTEREIFATHADEIVTALDGKITLAELGAGTATKTGLLLAAALRHQPQVLYQPIDVSPTALDEASRTLEHALPGVIIHAQVANYITESIRVERLPGTRVLALYIGSSIGNFTPEEAHLILSKLRQELQPGDALLLGTDLAPGPNKSVHTLLAAYDDPAGVTAAFNLNILTHLNRELGSNFDLTRFRHVARWNQSESRIEMHLESLTEQTVDLPADAFGRSTPVHFAAGETIHTENSRKFTEHTIASLLKPAGFTTTRTFHDPQQLFAVTLASAV